MLSYERPATMGQPNSVPVTTDHLPIQSTTSKTMANGATPSNAQLPSPNHHHIWLITGPAGCGKSTVAQYIAESLSLPYLEGDDFHSPANIAKMASGIPLTDSDRWDWLTCLRDASLAQLASGSHGVVLTCSALKRKYRDVIRVAAYYDADVRVHFVYLHADEKVLQARVAARQGHYMTAGMVRSQFEALEEPTSEETDVITVDVSSGIDEVEREALEKVTMAMQGEQMSPS